MQITYYAVAENSKGKLEQLRIVRENGAPISQEWTGKKYPTMAEAIDDLTELNCKTGRKHA
jgi:hypothetical protein